MTDIEDTRQRNSERPSSDGEARQHTEPPQVSGSPIPTHGIGRECGTCTMEVTPRMTLAYAAGIGASDELYLDDARPEGAVAPLPFIVSLEWPVMMSPEFLDAIGRDERTAYKGLVHAFQDTTFHRAIRPHDRLQVAGRIVEISNTRAGALVVCRIGTRSAADEEPVADSWFGAMYRYTPLDGAPGCRESRPALRGDAAVSEDGIERQGIDIARGLPHVYTECARIWNPIHTERRAALADGLPDIIVHGTCTWAMALQQIAGRYRAGSAQPLRRFAARFSRPVVPGQRVTLEHRLSSTNAVDFAVRHATGELALSHGYAELG